MPSRNQKRRSIKQRAEYLQKQDDILSQENKAKARVRYKADPEKKKASVHDSYKVDPEKKKTLVRDSYKADPEKKKASVRDSYNADIESKQSAKRQRYQEDLEENRAAKRQRYQEDVEENRAAKRQRYQEDVEETALLKGRNTRTIQLPLRHLKGRDLPFTSHVKACMVTQLLCTVLCDLSIEYWGVILNLMHKKASLSDVKKATFDTMTNF